MVVVVDMQGKKPVVQSTNRVGGEFDGAVKTGFDLTRLFQGMGIAAGAIGLSPMLQKPKGKKDGI